MSAPFKAGVGDWASVELSAAYVGMGEDGLRFQGFFVKSAGICASTEPIIYSSRVKSSVLPLSVKYTAIFSFSENAGFDVGTRLGEEILWSVLL